MPPLARRLCGTLYVQVLLAIAAGAVLGYVAPTQAAAMKPLGDGFIKLIKMLIPPIIFCTVVTGVAGMHDMKSAGRVGLKAIAYFEIMTSIALVIGLAVMHLWQPGAALHVDPATLNRQAVEAYAGKAAESMSVTEFFLNIIPATLSDAFVKGDLLQVLLVSLLFALALMSLGERVSGLYALIRQFSDTLFTMIGFIVKLAPIGAFGAMAFTVGTYGIGALGALGGLMLGFYATCLLFIGIVLGSVMRLCGLRLWPFLRYIREELLIVLGTSSSEAALPRLIEKMIALGCTRPVAGMVIPAGYSFNLDGTSIYLTMAALFVAQALGVQLSFGEEITVLGVLLLTSKGAAGVTGSGFIVLAGTLSVIGRIPVEGLALILGIDRFMSEARAITNFIGNGVGTIVIARWEKVLDLGQARHVLSIGNRS